MRRNLIVMPAKAGIHVAATRQRIRHFVTTWIPAFAGMTVLFIAAAAYAKEFPSVNLDDYTQDKAATMALGDLYPAGSDVIKVMVALERSIPIMQCKQITEQAYSCFGRSLFRGGMIYVRNWRVDIKATGGKLEAIMVESETSALNSESDL